VTYAGIALSDIAYLLLRRLPCIILSLQVPARRTIQAPSKSFPEDGGAAGIQRQSVRCFFALKWKRFPGSENNQRTRSRRGHLIKGYTEVGSVPFTMAASRSRSLIVAHYLEKLFHFSAKKHRTDAAECGSAPILRKGLWDGACIVASRRYCRDKMMHGQTF